MKAKKWVVFFSQTGSEIFEICEAFGKTPDLIVTNKSWSTGSKINIDFMKYVQLNQIPVVTLPNRPTLQDYEILTRAYSALFDNCIITLHGYLRILPPDFCSKYLILNGHPGLITKYPILKGFNPQEKAFKLKLESSGAVIHQVTAEVDSGEILAEREVSIKDLDLEAIYETLHSTSVQLWIDTLKNYL